MLDGLDVLDYAAPFLRLAALVNLFSQPTGDRLRAVNLLNPVLVVLACEFRFEYCHHCGSPRGLSTVSFRPPNNSSPSNATTGGESAGQSPVAKLWHGLRPCDPSDRRSPPTTQSTRSAPSAPPCHPTWTRRPTIIAMRRRTAPGRFGTCFFRADSPTYGARGSVGPVAPSENRATKGESAWSRRPCPSTSQTSRLGARPLHNNWRRILM